MYAGEEQTETVGEKEKESKKETAVLMEAQPASSLSNPKSQRDCQTEKEHRQLVPTLTWVMAPNGVHTSPLLRRSSQENSQPKSGRSEWQQIGGSEFLSQSTGPPQPSSQSEGSTRQERSTLRNDCLQP